MHIPQYNRCCTTTIQLVLVNLVEHPCFPHVLHCRILIWLKLRVPVQSWSSIVLWPFNTSVLPEQLSQVVCVWLVKERVCGVDQLIASNLWGTASLPLGQPVLVKHMYIPEYAEINPSTEPGLDCFTAMNIMILVLILRPRGLFWSTQLCRNSDGSKACLMLWCAQRTTHHLESFSRHRIAAKEWGDTGCIWSQWSRLFMSL